MLRKHSIAIALGFLTLLAAIEVANARIFVTTFSGTRGQVVAACTGSDRTLIEGTDVMGVGFSICMDHRQATSVTCDDAGDCVGSFGDSRGPRTKPSKGAPRDARLAPPPSLSEPVESSAAETPAPTPEPTGDVIYLPDIL